MRGLNVHPSHRQLEWQGRSETLEPRVMQVFVALARANGRILARDDLVEICWAGRIVGEDAINRTLSRLRGVLLALDAKGFAIETITKVGYRLIGPGDDGRAHLTTVAPAPASDRHLSRRLFAEYRLIADPAATGVMPRDQPPGHCRRRCLHSAGARRGRTVASATRNSPGWSTEFGQPRRCLAARRCSASSWRRLAVIAVSARYRSQQCEGAWPFSTD